MQLVNVNTDMSRLIERARAAAAAAAAGEDDPNARQNRIANMSLSLRLWLELQSALNGLLDSTTVDRRTAAAAPPVSHADVHLQSLHMMGRIVCKGQHCVMSGQTLALGVFVHLSSSRGLGRPDAL